MAIKRFWVIFLILALISVSLILLPTQDTLAGTNFLLRKYTFSNGGGQLSSSHFVLNATFGQPSAIGQLSSSNLRLQAGYWGGDTTITTVHHHYLPLVVK